jgi:hypothetical protein
MGKGRLIEGNGPKKVSLVGQGRRRHLELFETPHQGLDPDRAFQEGELAVKVEMDETGFHAGIIVKSGKTLAANWRELTQISKTMDKFFEFGLGFTKIDQQT